MIGFDDFFGKLLLNLLELRSVESLRRPGVDEDQLMGLGDLQDLPRPSPFVNAAFHHRAADWQSAEQFRSVGDQLC